MLKEIIAVIEPVQIYTVFTFIIAVLFYRPNNHVGRLLFLILFVNAVTEIAASILLFEKKSIGLLYSIMLATHNVLWILLLSKSIVHFKYFRWLFGGYLVFGIINFLFLEGFEKFNFNTFLLGSFVYIALFIYESFYQLQQEHFDFFLSNHFVLLFAPVLYLLGVSFVFGFQSRTLAETIIFGNVGLYEFIVTFVNIIYYTLIIFYIYREKRIRHDV